MTDQLRHACYTFVLSWMLLPISVCAQTLEAVPHPGQQLLETYCTVCHNLDYVEMQPRLTQKQAQNLWPNTVNKMVQLYGAEIPNQLTQQAIIDYLILLSKRSSSPHHASAEEDADISHTHTNFVPQ